MKKLTMDDNDVRTNSIKAWYLAVRPKTLSGAAVPVIIGTALAMCDSDMNIRIVPALLCFLFALIMQIDANFVNDYYDFIRGNDDDTRLGPKRACAQGWITTKAMRNGIMAVTAMACCVGLPLILYGGWTMLIVGIMCVVFCFLYTTYLSYVGLGDVLVLMFFGLLPVTLTYYLEMPSHDNGLPVSVIMTALSTGFVIDTLLVINNYRDIDNDRRAGKMTLVTRIGKKASAWLYLGLGVAACALNALSLYGKYPLAALLPFLYLIPHHSSYRLMVRIGEGKQLNRVLGMTARNMFVYGVLTTVGFLGSYWLFG